ncbi:hypothetical protein Ddc_15166 [Ditylenchus destructor]|nr:hypothetical protein Ddc_15166 [Ditylenchus destructor]
MELSETKSQLVTKAVTHSARPVKLAVKLVIVCGLIPYITVIIVNWEDDFVAEILTMHFILIICITFIPLVLTYLRFKNAYKEFYSKDSCPTDILKYIDKQRRNFVFINIFRSVLLYGFLPEFPLYSFFRYSFKKGLNEFGTEPRTEQHFNRALAWMTLISIATLIFIMAFNAIIDFNVFRQKFGKLFNPGSCLRCENTIEVDVTNLYCVYCRDCEKLRKEVEKAHFLPNSQQKVIISSYIKPLKYAAFMQHFCFLALYMKLFNGHSNFFLFWILISMIISLLYACLEFGVVKCGIYDKFSLTFTQLIVFPPESGSVIGLRKTKSLRNIAIVLTMIRTSLILLLFMLSFKSNLRWIDSQDFMKDKNVACVAVVVFAIALFYLLHWIFFDIALAKMAGPKMCPWCAQRPIVKQLESGGRSKEDEKRRQFESCEECLRM